MWREGIAALTLLAGGTAYGQQPPKNIVNPLEEEPLAEIETVEVPMWWNRHEQFRREQDSLFAHLPYMQQKWEDVLETEKEKTVYTIIGGADELDSGARLATYYTATDSLSSPVLDTTRIETWSEEAATDDLERIVQQSLPEAKSISAQSGRSFITRRA
ncbi:MAG: hypothetical protein ABEI52_06975, partial [Halobacteriaceae archaeon]